MAHNIIDADSGDILARVDNIAYIRLQDNGTYGLCPESHAQGVSDGSRAYQLAGRPEMAAAEPLPRVVIARVDSSRETAALSTLVGASFQAQIISDRAAGTGAISDDVILQSAAVVEYPLYEDKRAYIVGQIIRSTDGLLFEVKADHTSNATAYPLKTTFGYYRLIELTHAGTLADPIPYPEEAGILVNVVDGKYYSYKGATYKATQDVPDCSWYPGQPGVHFWELATAATPEPEQPTEPEQPAVASWDSLPANHPFAVGDKFTDGGKTYEVKRVFTKQAHFRPPTLTGDYYVIIA